MRSKVRAYSHQGHGPRADQQAGYISATSDSTPSLAKGSRSIHLGQHRSTITLATGDPLWSPVADIRFQIETLSGDRPKPDRPYSAAAVRLARLRSLASRRRFLRRIAFGVTSTNSSSAI